MCRKNVLQGCCLACFGMGILIGYALDSWLLCTMAGLGLILLGLLVMKQR